MVLPFRNIWLKPCPTHSNRVGSSRTGLHDQSGAWTPNGRSRNHTWHFHPLWRLPDIVSEETQAITEAQANKLLVCATFRSIDPLAAAEQTNDLGAP